MLDKFKVPETFEEAVQRKEELLNKLNQYNEDFFNGNTTYTEEEIKLIKEEYEFLDEYVDVDGEFAVEAPVEKGFFDKVNIFVWIYALFALFSGVYIVQQLVGFELFKIVYTAGLFDNFGNAIKYIFVILCFVVYPLILMLITLILKFLVFKKTAEDKKAFKWVFLGQIAFLLINFVVSYFVIIDMIFQMIKD